MSKEQGSFALFSIMGLFLLLVMGVSVFYITEKPSQDIRSYAAKPRFSPKAEKKSPTPTPKPQTATPSASPKSDLSTSDALDEIERDLLTTNVLLLSIDEESATVLGIATEL